MRDPQGYLIIEVEGRTPVQYDTFTCSHCNGIVKVPARADPTDLGGFCARCDKLICPGCVKGGRCVTAEARLDAIEARARRGVAPFMDRREAVRRALKEGP